MSGLPLYATTGQRVWYYSFRVICGLIFFFLIAPIVVIIPLSFNAQDFFTFTPEMLALDPAGFARSQNRGPALCHCARHCSGHISGYGGYLGAFWSYAARLGAPFARQSQLGRRRGWIVCGLGNRCLDGGWWRRGSWRHGAGFAGEHHGFLRERILRELGSRRECPARLSRQSQHQPWSRRHRRFRFDATF